MVTCVIIIYIQVCTTCSTKRDTRNTTFMHEKKILSYELSILSVHAQYYGFSGWFNFQNLAFIEAKKGLLLSKASYISISFSVKPVVS